jgi:hypothetical protein
MTGQERVSSGSSSESAKNAKSAAPAGVKQEESVAMATRVDRILEMLNHADAVHTQTYNAITKRIDELEKMSRNGGAGQSGANY